MTRRAFTPHHGSPALEARPCWKGGGECGPRSNLLERGGEEGESPKGDSPKPRTLARGAGFTDAGRIPAVIRPPPPPRRPPPGRSPAPARRLAPCPLTPARSF